MVPEYSCRRNGNEVWGDGDSPTWVIYLLWEFVRQTGLALLGNDSESTSPV
jgi:hypothetical protein